eukprot:11096790-Karenia_brevis.AAC.1
MEEVMEMAEVVEEARVAEVYPASETRELSLLRIEHATNLAHRSCKVASPASSQLLVQCRADGRIHTSCVSCCSGSSAAEHSKECRVRGVCCGYCLPHSQVGFAPSRITGGAGHASHLLP